MTLCMRASIVDAFFLGFNVFVPMDCVGVSKPEKHKGVVQAFRTYQYCEMTHTKILLMWLKKAKRQEDDRNYVLLKMWKLAVKGSKCVKSTLVF